MKITFGKGAILAVLFSAVLLFNGCEKQEIETITFIPPDNMEEFIPTSKSEDQSVPRPTKPESEDAKDFTRTESSSAEETVPSDVSSETSDNSGTAETDTSQAESSVTPEESTEPPQTPAPPAEETTLPPAPPPGGIYPTDDPYALAAQKAVYITFDDGPSSCTPYVLDVLDQYGIKACFFVTYQPMHEDLYRQIVNRGHTIGIHTGSHQYEQIYSSFDAWLADFQQAYQYVIQVTGVTPVLYRFPGGSRNGYLSGEVKTQIINYLHSNGIEYYDWNVDTSDSYVVISHEEMLNSTFGDFTNRTLPIILMHDGDGQQQTITVLPEILSRIQSMGYSFRRLDQTVPVIQQDTRWDY